MNGDPSPGMALIAKENPQMSQEFMNYSTKAMHDYQIVVGKPEAGEKLGSMTRQQDAGTGGRFGAPKDHFRSHPGGQFRAV